MTQLAPQLNSGGNTSRTALFTPIANDPPSRLEPSRLEPSRLDPSRLEPSRLEPSRLEPSRSEHSVKFKEPSTKSNSKRRRYETEHPMIDSDTNRVPSTPSTPQSPREYSGSLIALTTAVEAARGSGGSLFLGTPVSMTDTPLYMDPPPQKISDGGDDGAAGTTAGCNLLSVVPATLPSGTVADGVVSAPGIPYVGRGAPMATMPMAPTILTPSTPSTPVVLLTSTGIDGKLGEPIVSAFSPLHPVARSNAPIGLGASFSDTGGAGSTTSGEEGNLTLPLPVSSTIISTTTLPALKKTLLLSPRDNHARSIVELAGVPPQKFSMNLAVTLAKVTLKGVLTFMQRKWVEHGEPLGSTPVPITGLRLYHPGGKPPGWGWTDEGVRIQDIFHDDLDSVTFSLEYAFDPPRSNPDTELPRARIATPVGHRGSTPRATLTSPPGMHLDMGFSPIGNRGSATNGRPISIPTLSTTQTTLLPQNLSYYTTHLPAPSYPGATTTSIYTANSGPLYTANVNLYPGSGDACFLPNGLGYQNGSQGIVSDIQQLESLSQFPVQFSKII